MMSKQYLLELARYADQQPTNKGDKYLLRKLYAIRLIQALIEQKAEAKPAEQDLNDTKEILNIIRNINKNE